MHGRVGFVPTVPPLDIGIKLIEIAIPVARVERLHEGAYDLHVLLRHRLLPQPGGFEGVLLGEKGPVPARPAAGRALPRRRAHGQAPPARAYRGAHLLERSPGRPGRRGSAESPPHPSRRPPTPECRQSDRGRRANPWTRAAFASRHPSWRTYSRSGRNPRTAPWSGSPLSPSVWECPPAQYPAPPRMRNKPGRQVATARAVA